MKIQRMKTNRIVNPLGFDLKTPHVSWTVTDTEAKKQLWARVEVSKTENFADVIFDTGACKTASSLGVPVEIALEPRTRYFWRVTVMGDNGELVTSDTAWFETAKLDEPFTAQRISPCLAPDTAPYMRRAFEITGEVLNVMKQLAEKHTTMIVVTHEMGFAKEVADRVVFMSDGKIVEQGNPTELFEHPKSERRVSFLGSMLRA